MSARSEHTEGGGARSSSTRAAWGLREGDEMAQAFVMTATELGFGDRRALWVVLADTPGLAIETARANGCNVDQVVGTLSEETVERLEIQPGQPKLL
jgi:hypothetical protein